MPPGAAHSAAAPSAGTAAAGSAAAAASAVAGSAAAAAAPTSKERKRAARNKAGSSCAPGGSSSSSHSSSGSSSSSAAAAAAAVAELSEWHALADGQIASVRERLTSHTAECAQQHDDVLAELRSLKALIEKQMRSAKGNEEVRASPHLCTRAHWREGRCTPAQVDASRLRAACCSSDLCANPIRAVRPCPPPRICPPPLGHARLSAPAQVLREQTTNIMRDVCCYCRQYVDMRVDVRLDQAQQQQQARSSGGSSSNSVPAAHLHAATLVHVAQRELLRPESESKSGNKPAG
jgi:hypothetical protein